MFTAVIHEGETVTSPTGRHWIVQGWGELRKKVLLLAADGTGEEVELSPRLLRHVNSSASGLTLEQL